MRPRFKDRTKVRVRCTLTLLPALKEKAKQIGDGNISQGIEKALENYKK